MYRLSCLSILSTIVSLFGPSAMAAPIPEPPGPVMHYSFLEGEGTEVFDVSSSTPPLDLTFETTTARWRMGGGLELLEPTAVSSSLDAANFVEACIGSGALTVAVWIDGSAAEEARTEDPQRILTLSENDVRNFSLSYVGAGGVGGFEVRLRSDQGLGDSVFWLTEEPAGKSGRAASQHVVFTRDASGNARLFINGTSVGTGFRGGGFSNWSNLPLTLGAEPDGSSPWTGLLREAALYDRALSAGEVQAQFAAGPPLNTSNGPDIDVTYISRTPRIDYDAVPDLPQNGQTVYWVAHVRNRGTSTLSLVEYDWSINGSVVSTGSLVSVPAGAERTVSLPWTWNSNPHDIQFRADPNNIVAEITNANNARTVRSTSLGVGLWVEQSVRNYFDLHQFNYQQTYGINDGANSWEDWAQRQIQTWNDMLAAAVYPSAPAGGLDRVRLDRVVVVPDGTLPLNGGLPTNHPDTSDKTVDMMWGFPAPVNTSFYDINNGSSAFNLEPSLIHELLHARFMVDTYGLNIHGKHVDVRDGSGTRIFPNNDDFVRGSAAAGCIMDGNNLCFAEWEINWLNAYAGQRALDGWANFNAHYGLQQHMELISAYPANNVLRILDSAGNPLVGAQVLVYQSEDWPDPSTDHWYSKYFDNYYEMSPTTNIYGQVSLGSNPFYPAPNMHGGNYYYGTNFLRILYQGQEAHAWFDTTQMHVRWFRGQTGTTVYDIPTSIIGGGGSQADLQATVWASDTSPSVGERATYTVQVTQLGPATAGNVTIGTVTQSVPTGGLGYVGHSATTGTYTPSNGNWVIPSLAPGARATLMIEVDVLQTGTHTTIATRNASTPTDPNGGNDSDSVVVQSFGPSHPRIVASGGGNFYWTGNSVKAWGYNTSGQLGMGHSNSVNTAQTSLFTQVSHMSGGNPYTLAVKSGQVWGAGGGNATPFQGAGFVAEPVQVATAGFHHCARLVDGRVYCWGSNWAGQLGDGTFDDRSLPVPVSNLYDAVDVVVGDWYSCAVRATGQVVCWGYNSNGELGDGSYTHRNVPSPVVGISDGLQVEADNHHTCVLRSTGQIRCFGRNNNGQLGNGTTSGSNVPVTVSGISNAVEVGVGNEHSCARLSTSEVKCWGDNSSKQLGDGTSSDRWTPVYSTISGGARLNGAQRLAVGGWHTCAAGGGGNLPGVAACWGDNEVHQLGDGTTTPRNRARAVVGLP